jgi:hypothetical protein
MTANRVSADNTHRVRHRTACGASPGNDEKNMSTEQKTGTGEEKSMNKQLVKIRVIRGLKLLSKTT